MQLSHALRNLKELGLNTRHLNVLQCILRFKQPTCRFQEGRLPQMVVMCKGSLQFSQRRGNHQLEHCPLPLCIPDELLRVPYGWRVEQSAPLSAHANEIIRNTKAISVHT